MLPVASTVNTDLKWRFSVSAFSLGLVIILPFCDFSVLMPVLSFLLFLIYLQKSFLLSESLEDKTLILQGNQYADVLVNCVHGGASPYTASM